MLWRSCCLNGIDIENAGIALAHSLSCLREVYQNHYATNVGSYFRNQDYILVEEATRRIIFIPSVAGGRLLNTIKIKGCFELHCQGVGLGVGRRRFIVIPLVLCSVIVQHDLAKFNEHMKELASTISVTPEANTLTSS